MLLDLPLEIGVAANDYALVNACDNGHTENVRLLLELPQERGVNPSALDNAAIRFACQGGHTEIVRLLLDLERGVDPSAQNNYALRWATSENHANVVRLLLGSRKTCAA